MQNGPHEEQNDIGSRLEQEIAMLPPMERGHAYVHFDSDTGIHHVRTRSRKDVQALIKELNALRHA